MIEEEREKEYTPSYTFEIPIEEQEISDEAIAMSALLHLNYWCEDENEKEMLKTVQSQLGIEDSNTIFREKYEREGTSPYEYMGEITYDKEKNIYKEAERDRTYHKYDLIDTKKSEIDMKKLKIKISPLFPE